MVSTPLPGFWLAVFPLAVEEEGAEMRLRAKWAIR